MKNFTFACVDCIISSVNLLVILYLFILFQDMEVMNEHPELKSD